MLAVLGFTGSAMLASEGRMPSQGCRHLPGAGPQAELDRPSLGSVSLATLQIMIWAEC